ncbi:MAG: hypothetical protein M1832_002026 [Thelocarpon impressellum]|nr:MAG: hypothetical protein M1832_002026 [Thelocarpon impressellum]
MELMVPQRRHDQVRAVSPRSSSQGPPPARDGDHHHHRPHRHRRDRKVPQSAVQLTAGASFGEPRPRKKSGSGEGTPSASRTHSRRTSTAVNEGEGSGDGSGGEPRNAEGSSEVDLLREREKARLRNEELLASLSQLNNFSNAATRRLDDTYYSILEKLSSLQSTTASLQEVSGLTAQLHGDFEAEARELDVEMRGQVADLGGFETQQQRIVALQARMRAAKERAGGLVARLEAVDTRVEGWERKESEWHALTTKRLRILWGFIAACTVAFLALFLFHHFTHPQPLQPRERRDFNGTMPLKDLLAELEVGRGPSGSRSVTHVEATSTPREGRDNEARMTMFDEL